jgi:hypothetical protein
LGLLNEGGRVLAHVLDNLHAVFDIRLFKLQGALKAGQGVSEQARESLE